MNTLNSQVVFFVFSMLFIPCSTLAESIQADRPGFSTGTYTVKPGVYYIELGFQYDYSDSVNTPDVITAPLANFRMGINTTTELNILVDGWILEKGRKSTLNTANNISIGVKSSLIKAKKYNVSLLGYLSSPTNYTPNLAELSPLIGILWDYELTTSINVFGTFQFVSFIEKDQRNNNMQTAIGLGLSLTSQMSGYIEYFKDTSLNSITNNLEIINTGIAYLLTKNIQIDTYIGISTDNNINHFWGIGFAMQF